VRIDVVRVVVALICTLLLWGAVLFILHLYVRRPLLMLVVWLVTTFACWYVLLRPDRLRSDFVVRLRPPRIPRLRVRVRLPLLPRAR
jgi:hypothetical protein